MAALNWRNADDYAYTEKLTSSQWAWEFLRRSKTYIDSWQDYLIDPDDRSFSWLPGSVFGTSHLLDPSLTALECQPDWVPQFELVPDPETADLFTHPGIVSLSFDIAKPLVPQLELARQHLERAQQQVLGEWPQSVLDTTAPRFRRGNFALYLRLLDAERKPTSIGEMARVLFPETAEPRSSVKSMLHTARSIADWGYMFLLYEAAP